MPNLSYFAVSKFPVDWTPLDFAVRALNPGFEILTTNQPLWTLLGYWTNVFDLKSTRITSLSLKSSSIFTWYGLPTTHDASVMRPASWQPTRRARRSLLSSTHLLYKLVLLATLHLSLGLKMLVIVLVLVDYVLRHPLPVELVLEDDNEIQLQCHYLFVVQQLCQLILFCKVQTFVFFRKYCDIASLNPPITIPRREDKDP